MSSSLASRQGILRRSINRLSSLLHDHRDLLAQRLDSVQEPGAEDRKVLLRTVKRAETAIHLERERLESALDKYTSTADNLDANVQIPSDTLEKVETNVEAAHELLDEALTALTTLTVLQQELGSLEVTHSSETPDTSCISNMKLAPIPVPKFSGEIWEWETFWKSFEHSVDSKNIDDIYKLNYLLDSLQGRVRESVKHFEVSGAAYPLVVAYLKNKYDDKEALIERLLHNLQFARARTNRLEDQEALCEELQSIVSQLKIKGEHVDNVFLQRQLINKFSPEVQRHVIRQKTKNETEGSWNTLTLLLIAKEYIRGELRVTRQMKQCTICDTSQEISSNPYETQHRKLRQNLCFYCGKSGHQPVNCNEATSLKQRLQIIKTQKLCRNCGRKDHIAANCTSGACRLCRESGHHTSICEKLNLLPSDETRILKTAASIMATTNPQTIKSSTTINLTSTSALEHPKPQDIPPFKDFQDVQVLVGQARVLNPTTGELEAIYVMLDSGANRSFIRNDLADRLQLKSVNTTRLEINTFGSRKPMKKTSTNTFLRMWDMEGTQHAFSVTRIDTITKPLKRSSLSTEDKKFLTENNIHVSIDPSIKKIQPAVLLGCADLLSLLDVGLKTEYTLPSGLKLIPSRLGYLITGRNNAQVINHEKPPVQTVQKTNTQEELPSQQEAQQSWEQFCGFERNGTNEFAGLASEERRLTNGFDPVFQGTVASRRRSHVAQEPLPSEVEVPKRESMKKNGNVPNVKEPVKIQKKTQKEPIKKKAEPNNVMPQGPAAEFKHGEEFRKRRTLMKYEPEDDEKNSQGGRRPPSKKEPPGQEKKKPRMKQRPSESGVKRKDCNSKTSDSEELQENAKRAKRIPTAKPSEEVEQKVQQSSICEKSDSSASESESKVPLSVEASSEEPDSETEASSVDEDTEESPVVDNSRRRENSQVRRRCRYNLKPRRTNHDQSEIQPQNSLDDAMKQEYITTCRRLISPRNEIMNRSVFSGLRQQHGPPRSIEIPLLSTHVQPG
uniref:CCHC-type domain-containing protein n=1 Tax=Haemonchus contortus TaxID=6289 RepID=A0A7I4Y674_HAECO